MTNRIIVLFLALAPLLCKSQNLQMHYDFGEDRKFITTTLEMFKPDTLGSTFWFVDFDFNSPGSPRSISSAYWEIAREFFIPGFDQLAIHFEYNDGFTSFKISEDLLGAASYNSVFLAGFSYPLEFGSVVLSTQWLLRLPRGMNRPDFQFTLVWFQPVFKEKLIFTGYADFYSQDKIMEPDQKDLIFQSEPQIWYMILPKIGVGGELEISKNFPYGPNEWEFLPTLALKWEF